MAQSAAFTQIEWANVSASNVDVSASTKKTQIPRGSNPTDLTTFGTGGTRAVTNQVRGAGNSNVTQTVLVDATTWPLLCQLAGNNNGFLFRAKTGIDAAPTTGDELFTGTYVMTGFKLHIEPDKEVTADVDLRPAAVSGAVIPTRKKL